VRIHLRVITSFGNGRNFSQSVHMQTSEPRPRCAIKNHVFSQSLTDATSAALDFYGFTEDYTRLSHRPANALLRWISWRGYHGEARRQTKMHT
jgi:hypothetical protein